MTALLPSGVLKDRELLLIVTDNVKFVLKGKYNVDKHIQTVEEVAMHFDITGPNNTVKLYDPIVNDLVEYDSTKAYNPIFFENGNYEVVIIPNENSDKSYSFYHEYAPFREAISRLTQTNILTGNLRFQNEVGRSILEVRENNETYLCITIEVFPTKIDYMKDYQALLHDITDEIYNLAYSFIQRTHMNSSSTKIFSEPSPTEFYRLLEEHFEDYERAINQVERTPHHQLQTTHEIVRGEKLRKLDSTGRNYLRKNAKQFIEVPNGIELHGRTMLPQKGLLIKKENTVDTHENRYIKWTMIRIHTKVKNLISQYKDWCKKQQRQVDPDIYKKLSKMMTKLERHLAYPIWKQVGKLDRSIQSLVLQMASGYREIYKIYGFLFQSLVLYGDMYKMSVKNIATLYEYWTFIKLGKILREKCQLVNQDIVRYEYGGVYVRLQQNQQSTFNYLNPITGEQITLQYQYQTKESPTVKQEPDSMLSIGKKGKDYLFHYIFDAKYKLEVNDGEIGPKSEDINTMHRYRDSIVEEQKGKYERTAFGAYVLFPWIDDKNYINHQFYKSIEKVNIGGLPFLPNSTMLVEQIIDNLLNKSADELQREGILPRGAITYVKEVEEQALLVPLTFSELEDMKKRRTFKIENAKLPIEWKQAKLIAFVDFEGVKESAEIESFIIVADDVVFTLTTLVTYAFPKLTYTYVLVEPVLVSKKALGEAETLSQAFIKPGRQFELWQLFKRMQKSIVSLSETELMQSSSITGFYVDEQFFEWKNGELYYENNQIDLTNLLPYEQFQIIANLLKT